MFFRKWIVSVTNVKEDYNNCLYDSFPFHLKNQFIHFCSFYFNVNDYFAWFLFETVHLFSFVYFIQESAYTYNYLLYPKPISALSLFMCAFRCQKICGVLCFTNLNERYKHSSITFRTFSLLCAIFLCVLLKTQIKVCHKNGRVDPRFFRAYFLFSFVFTVFLFRTCLFLFIKTFNRILTAF